jgi:endonuclease/exonuclease/phosphatase family metal-dependent hydrolase
MLANPTGGREGKQMVVVATWNLENLFRPDTDFGPKTQDVYEAKLAGLGRVIGAMQPDILAVEEVGDPEALADLAERLDGDWHIETATVFEAHHPIRVGFLSRLQMTAVEQVSAFPDRLAPVQADDEGTTIVAMPRGALRVRISADGRELDLVACHLKSKLLSFPGGFQPKDEGERARYGDYALARRAAEAVTVRAFADTLLDGQGRERPVVVLGDLNDEPLAATTQIVLGPPGSELETAGFGQPDRGDGMRLWNLAPRLIKDHPDHAFTRMFHGRGELIDHILVSHVLATALVDVDTADVALPSITENPTARRDAPASDHAPLVARFNLS